LLGQVAASAETASGCDHDGGNSRPHILFLPNSKIRFDLPFSWEWQKDFHRSKICCNAALALPQLLAKL
jgi:hypothetical protein